MCDAECNGTRFVGYFLVIFIGKIYYTYLHAVGEPRDSTSFECDVSRAFRSVLERYGTETLKVVIAVDFLDDSVLE